MQFTKNYQKKNKKKKQDASYYVSLATTHLRTSAPIGANEQRTPSNTPHSQSHFHQNITHLFLPSTIHNKIYYVRNVHVCGSITNCTQFPHLACTCTWPECPLPACSLVAPCLEQRCAVHQFSLHNWLRKKQSNKNQHTPKTQRGKQDTTITTYNLPSLKDLMQIVSSVSSDSSIT